MGNHLSGNYKTRFEGSVNNSNPNGETYGGADSRCDVTWGNPEQLCLTCPLKTCLNDIDNWTERRILAKRAGGG